MQKIVLATNNIHKIREISQIIEGLPLQLLSKDDFENFPDVEETGKLLEDNAVLKAEAIYEFTGLPSMADDSGLEVEFLNGEPGVMSARYAGPGCNFADNNRKLLKALQGVPTEKRGAAFRCVIAICFGPGDTELVEGRVEGIITEEIRGQEGFGYDPVFYFPQLNQTFAEISPEQKNKISHRALAVLGARQILQQRFGIK